MSITSQDQLIAAAPGQITRFLKASVTAKASGTWQSLWTAAGTPTAGSTPASGAGAVPTSATAGAMFFNNPGSGISYLARMSGFMTTIGGLFLYDRLVHTSGLNGTLTTAQTVNSTALTRNTGGVSNELWLEWYTATGATASNVTASYTNQAGTSGRTTQSVALIATPVAGQMQQLPLQQGDTGVQSVQSVTLSASTGTAGNFGITIVDALADLSVILANTGIINDYALTGLPQVPDNACLSLMVLCSTTSTGTITGQLNILQG